MSEQMVRLRPGNKGGRPDVYHTDESCGSWPEEGWDKLLSAVSDEVRECQRCAGTLNEGNEKPNFEHLRSLKEAAKND